MKSNSRKNPISLSNVTTATSELGEGYIALDVDCIALESRSQVFLKSLVSLIYLGNDNSSPPSIGPIQCWGEAFPSRDD